MVCNTAHSKSLYLINSCAKVSRGIISGHLVLISFLYAPASLISPLALIFLIPLGTVGSYFGTRIVKNTESHKMKFLLAFILIIVGSWVLIDAFI